MMLLPFPQRQAGNVLFLILIAVALFAALTYAVSQSTRSNGGDTNLEQARLRAAQLLQFTTDIQMTIRRLRIAHNCADTQISFENPIALAAGFDYTNPNAPADKRCHVFDPAGGNVSFQRFSSFPTGGSTSALLTMVGFQSKNDITNIGRSGCGSDCAELTAMMFIYDRATCMAINAAAFNTAANPLPAAGYMIWVPIPFNGTYIGDTAGAIAEFVGQPIGCYEYGGSDGYLNYIFYHAVIER